MKWKMLFVLSCLFLGVQTAVSAPAGTCENCRFLPAIRKPEALPPSLTAVLQITPDGSLTASTYEGGSFRLQNPATNTENITAVSIDLSSATFPDMVFDPYGIAGDIVAKDLEVNSNGSLTGFQGHTYSQPHDDGFDVLNLAFAHFSPGESFSFSVDVDPTSIRGVAAPGPYQTGSVSGLELNGATITVTFGDGTVLGGQTWRLPGSNGGSQALVRAGVPEAGAVSVLGIAGNTAVVTESQQTVQVQTQPGRRVKVLVLEGGLFTEGVAGGGHDIDPFEANTALSVVEFEGLAHSNLVLVPVQLRRTQANGGLNHIVVMQETPDGVPGAVTMPIVLELQN